MRWLDGITDSMDMKCEVVRGDSEGQGGLARCSPWGRRESDTNEQVNSNISSMSCRHLMGHFS